MTAMADTSRGALFALIDCNNFYVSCERLFQPALLGKAVVVLSNNDGCVIAPGFSVPLSGTPTTQRSGVRAMKVLEI
jgi:DNA polymerase V